MFCLLGVIVGTFCCVLSHSPQVIKSHETEIIKGLGFCGSTSQFSQSHKAKRMRGHQPLMRALYVWTSQLCRNHLSFGLRMAWIYWIHPLLLDLHLWPSRSSDQQTWECQRLFELRLACLYQSTQFTQTIQSCWVTWHWFQRDYPPSMGPLPEGWHISPITPNALANCR